jgi:hypothetical protein
MLVEVEDPKELRYCCAVSATTNVLKWESIESASVRMDSILYMHYRLFVNLLEYCSHSCFYMYLPP